MFNNKSYSGLLFIILTICFIWQPVSMAYVVPDDVVVFDVWKYFEEEGIEDIQERADALYFITSLQGIVNRDEPRLYIFAALALFDVETKYLYDTNYQERPVTELDKFWFSHFEKEGYFKGRKIQRINDLKALVSKYKDSVNGLVLWNMKVPATSNVALVAAGCENLLPVSKDLAKGKFYQRIKDHIPSLEVRLDLTGKFDGKSPIEIDGKSYPTTGSAKNDCYRYIIEKYLKPGIANPYKMWFNCDASMWGEFRNHYGENYLGYLGDRNELQQNGMYNADYWVAQKAIFYDLSPWGDCKPADDPNQPLGADRNSWHDILETSYKLREGEFGVVGGFVPWWLKYTTHTGGKHKPVPTEWEFVSLLTSYNMGNDGDAAFGIANASFFQHLPAVSKKEAEFEQPPPIDYDPTATYIAILMLDYDGSAWVNQMITSVYNDPARGKMPLNWCINPVLYERVPHVSKYIYDNKTPNDFLGFSDDGASYIQPMSLFERNGRIKESGIPYYEKYAKAMNERFGIKYNVFYIDDTFDLKWAQMAARITPDGFGVNMPIEEQLVNGTPVNFVIHFHISQRAKFKKHLEQLYKASSENKQYHAKFEALRTILMPPSMIYEVVKEVEAEYPDANVKFIDVPNFYRLLKHKLTNPVETPYTEAESVSATPESKQGLQPIDVTDGPVNVVIQNSKKFWKVSNQPQNRYLYFTADKGFRSKLGKDIKIEIEYLDTDNGQILLQYNSFNSRKESGGAYEGADKPIILKNSGKLLKTNFLINDANLEGRQNGGADFRLINESDKPLLIKRIIVHRKQ